VKERSRGAGRREPTPSQAGRPEQKQTPQQRGEGIQERGERQPLSDVFDVLESRLQLQEGERAGRVARETWSLQQKMAFGKKFKEKQHQQGDELRSLYRQGTERDRLIIDVYRTMASGTDSSLFPWENYLSPQKTRDLIALLKPKSEDEICEELRKSQEALERKEAAFQKRDEALWLNRNLTPEERVERREKARREYMRNYRKRRREQAGLQAEEQPPTQEFQSPANE
jgi:hypothetical protein